MLLDDSRDSLADFLHRGVAALELWKLAGLSDTEEDRSRKRVRPTEEERVALGVFRLRDAGLVDRAHLGQ